MANQKSNQIPPWLTEVKEDAIRTNEWTDLTKQIYEAVEQHLSQNHVPYFTDLSNAEKSLLLERAARSLSSSDNGKLYENLQSKLSYLLDQSVNNQVAKKLIEESTNDTKSDLVLETTSEGILTLLKKHPDQRYKLRVFLNQIIPQPIRFLAWQLYFANPNHRKAFVSKLSTNPKLCLSPQDAEIQRRCETILSAPVFGEIGAWKGYSNSLKGVLSYYHSTFGISSTSSSASSRSRRPLIESEYMFGVPIVYAHHPPQPKNESPTEKSMATLVEIYMQFIATLPSAIAQSLDGNPDNPEMEMLIKNTANILDQYDQPLTDYFKDLARRTGSSGLEDITFLTTLKSICSPLISNLYSGYLSLNPLMFVWDQYTIGLDVPGYNEELISIITAIILMILRDQLMSVLSFGDLNDCVKSQVGFIQTRQIQTLLNKHFFKSLQSKLNSSPRFGPVIDPTAGRLKPWEHWHQDIIPRRTIKQKEPDNSDDRIQEEINRRVQGERMAKEEIERLRRELNDLKTRPNEQPPPQPRPRQTPPQTTNTPPVARERTPQPERKSKPVSENPSIDIFKRFKQSINKLANGDGEHRKKLDTQTVEDLRLHKLDLRIAEKQVFGHQLGPGEWDALTKSEKKARSDQMLEVVKQRLEKRYQETGKF